MSAIKKKTSSLLHDVFTEPDGGRGSGLESQMPALSLNEVRGLSFSISLLLQVLIIDTV